MHVPSILGRLRQHGLYTKLEKCVFVQDSIEFLGFILSPEDSEMNPHKVKAVLEWAAPQNV